MVISFEKIVAAAATAEALASAPSDANANAGYRCSWATIQAKSTNTKPVHIIAPTATSVGGYAINNPGDSLVLWSTALNDSFIDLTKVFVKVEVNGEGVDVIAVK